MKHQLKTVIFKTLNVLPNVLGYKLYHWLQNFSENKNIPYKIDSCNETYNSLQTILENLNYNLENKIIAEIGSGWLPIMPYLFLHKGKAKQILTFDLNQHFQQKSIKNFNNLFEDKYKIQLETEEKNYNLTKEISYFPKKNIAHTNLENVDLVFSRFVLEHVTPKELLAMHQSFKKLKQGSLVVHYISPSDHRAYSDASLSLQDFLQYSEKQWNNIQTKFDYHNRLRLPQYLQIFKTLGYSVEFLSFDSALNNPKALSIFKNLKIHEDFASFSTEELTAGSIIVVLKC